ncbi:hypothetical protein MVES1_003885 [Malassezia vespertilionis]|uniref:Large ribosomal subunit protein uL30m n=1 Tax=Malassezia vespertilionis TaxID=2020962 RepID=A0A2N1J825_9BASI|nr:uncharacterized protein MVES1_003885 [Malassezia vespertilionis]PKI82689.1 hypothetical protein MVES_003440 [Malassezia vespertilionis]WFD08509.1 hypothetical protein MVES1_003885 [Malassezia vespertilionis]
MNRTLFPTVPMLSRAAQTQPASLYQAGTPRLSSTNAEPTTHFRVTLRRSAIGLPKRSAQILEALGLHRRLQSVYHAQTPSIAGAILGVKELIHVENVRPVVPSVDATTSLNTVWVNAQGEVVDAGRQARKAPKGFRIIGNLVKEERDAALKARNAHSS